MATIKYLLAHLEFELEETPSYVACHHAQVLRTNKLT